MSPDLTRSMYCFLSTDDDSCLPFFLISAGQLYKDSYSDFLDVTATMGLFFSFLWRDRLTPERVVSCVVST